VQKTTICLVNKGVSRLLLQNQTFLTKVRSAYQNASKSQVNMDLAGYLQFLTEFDVVPTLCTRAQAQNVFELVNLCEEYVSSACVSPQNH
jgi:hypothetical protein